MQEIIHPAGWARPRGYSNGVIASGRVLAIAGQVAWDAEQRIVPGDFAAQFARALENVVEVVRAAGGAPEHLVRLTLLFVDKQEYLGAQKALGAEYRRIMGRHYPAMTAVEVKGLIEPGARIEIEGLAIL
jgi:enamine deaminase RidA (YjgF/YER057c/UK114 family)